MKEALSEQAESFTAIRSAADARKIKIGQLVKVRLTGLSRGVGTRSVPIVLLGTAYSVRSDGMTVEVCAVISSPPKEFIPVISARVLVSLKGRPTTANHGQLLGFFTNSFDVHCVESRLSTKSPWAIVGVKGHYFRLTSPRAGLLPSAGVSFKLAGTFHDESSLRFRPEIEVVRLVDVEMASQIRYREMVIDYRDRYICPPPVDLTVKKPVAKKAKVVIESEVVTDGGNAV